MTFEADLKALLEGVGTEAFPTFAPLGTAKPYITYQSIGGSVINPIANEIPGKRNAEMQINVWAATYAQALALIRAVEDAMRVTTAFQARPTSAPVDDYDHDNKVYGCLQTFTCWFDA